MIYYKSVEEIEYIRESSLLVSKTLAEVAKVIKPGVTSLQLDKIADEFIRDNGGVPAFKNFNGFPNSLCISTNEKIVHGIPDDKPFQDGDIVSVDCGVVKNKFYGDSAFTFPIGNVSDEIMKLLKVTRECLYKAIEKAVAGMRMGDIGFAVQNHAENNGYGVVKELVGHGIGKHLHEKPEVPNYGKRGSGIKLEGGLVIAIEPMINLGKAGVKHASDGWTISTIDGRHSAHFEHTIAIGKNKTEVLSTFDCIDDELRKIN